MGTVYKIIEVNKVVQKSKGGKNMKLKATKKDIRNNSNKILKLGYCECQTLLHYESAFAYSAGNMGWACDYYDINGVIISTGYNPIGDYIDYNLCNEYEALAREIVYNNYNESHEVKKEKITNLLSEFIQKAKGK